MVISIIIIASVVSFIIYIVIPVLIKVLMRKRFLTTVKRNRCFCLTFDDGPNVNSTLKILKLLKGAGIKATFFLLGVKIEKYPEIIKEILAQGHEIGDHGYNHLHPWKSNPFRYVADLIKSNRIIKKYVPPNRCITFRPPYGKLNIITLIYIFIMRRKIAFWDIDPCDYKKKSANEVAQFIKNNFHLGAVILLHDGRITPDSSNVEVTISSLEVILKSIKSNLQCFETINEAIHSSIE